MVLPRRSSFTQAGAVPGPPRCSPTVRRRDATLERESLAGRHQHERVRGIGVSRSRIMTPALTQAWTYSTDVTRAMTSASPLRRCQAKCSASALPQTSAPPPATLNVPFAALARPAGPTAPMSCDCHGAGSVGAGRGDDTVTATLAEESLSRPRSSVARAVSAIAARRQRCSTRTGKELVASEPIQVRAGIEVHADDGAVAVGGVGADVRSSPAR